MSKPLTAEQLVRASWLTELRRQGDRKCEGAYRSGTRVCALGLLHEVANARLRWDRHGSRGQKLAGLTEAQGERVVLMNDRRHTFGQIADVVEGWFK